MNTFKIAHAQDNLKLCFIYYIAVKSLLFLIYMYPL